MATKASTHIAECIRYTEDNIVTAAFAAVGDGLTLTKTVTGAAIGDVATASLSALPDDIAITASVTAANTVKVVLINGSGTASLNLADTMDLTIIVLRGWGDA